MCNYSVLPENLRGGMKRYVEHGIKPGSFLTACIANDFIEAVAQASTQTFEYLHSVRSFLYNEMPGRGTDHDIWGTYTAIELHVEKMLEQRNRLIEEAEKGGEDAGTEAGS